MCLPSFHLVAGYACKKLPDSVEKLVRDLYSFFNSSPKRTFEFKAFQELWALKPSKMLHPSNTRWLSLNQCVSVVLKYYTPLQGYFKVQDQFYDVMGGKNISQELDNPFTKLYLEFLAYILPYFISINIEMQSENVKIH